MKMHLWKRAVALMTVAAFLTTGCTTLQPVPLTQQNQSIARPDVKVGESVVVTKKDGAKQKFKVTAVEDAALVGKNVRVPYSEMASLDVQRADGAQGGHKGLIIGAVVLGVLAIAAAAGGGGGGGSGY
jgi:outer membrane PBP1 activator LpoA protein